ncbi:MAG: helix-turn-helix transcriptional regulator [Thermoguttaceae bacterium]|jgi:transcriptional regulator with XRE-family HTH domain
MVQTLVDKVAKTEEGRWLLEQEGAILEVTELICEVMEDMGVSRLELAKRLGKTKGYVSQLLDGSANMTLRTISDIFTALGGRMRCRFERADEYEFHASSTSRKVREVHPLVDQDVLLANTSQYSQVKPTIGEKKLIKRRPKSSAK